MSDKESYEFVDYDEMKTKTNKYYAMLCVFNRDTKITSPYFIVRGDRIGILEKGYCHKSVVDPSMYMRDDIRTVFFYASNNITCDMEIYRRYALKRILDEDRINSYH